MNVVRNTCANSCEQSGLYSMKKKTVFTVILITILIFSIFMLSACNQVPEEYRIENFYGTYDKPATDTYDVFIYHKSENIEEYISRSWDIVSIDGSNFSYRSRFTNEIVEDTYDPLILAEIKVLIEKFGSSVTVEKKRIVLNDPNIVIQYNKTQYYEDSEYQTLALIQNKDEVGCGRYIDIDDEKNVKVFCAFLTSTAVDENGVEFTIHVNKFFKK